MTATDHAIPIEPGMRIRPFQPADRAAIEAITCEAFEGVSIDRNVEQRFGAIAGHDWKWRKLRQIEDDLEAKTGQVLVAENEHSQVVGYITTRIDRLTGVGFIPNLAVRGAERGQGIGRRLIAAALDLFRAEGLQLARIETLEQNRVGRHLYPACGFVEVARQIHFAMRLDSG